MRVMDRDLSELLKYLTYANNEKLTERKKWKEQVKLLLEKDSTSLKLRNNSIAPEKKVLDWENVFKLIIKILNHDITAFNKSKGESSRKKLDSLCLVRIALQRSVVGQTCLLKANMVVKLLNQFLEDESLCFWYGKDMLNFVFKYYLSFKHAWTELDNKYSAEMLSHLVKIQEQLMKRKENSDFDMTTISKYLYLSTKSLGLSNVDANIYLYKHILNILVEFLKNIQLYDANNLAYDYNLKTFNVLTSTWLLDMRSEIGWGGEQLFVTALTILNKKTTEQLKVDLIIYFHLQIILHANFRVDLVKICNDDEQLYQMTAQLWKTLLRQLFDSLVECLRKDHNMGKFLINNTLTKINESLSNNSFVNLLSEVIHELSRIFSNDSSWYSILFSYSSSSSAILSPDPEFKSNSSQPPLKKIKCSIDSFLNTPSSSLTTTTTDSISVKKCYKTNCPNSWSWLKAITFSPNSGEFHIWFQVTKNLLTKHPEHILEIDIEFLLDIFLNILCSCKKLIIIQSTIECLYVVACQVEKIDEDMFTRLISQWSKIGSYTERFLVAHHFSDATFSLLNILIKYNMLVPITEVNTILKSNLFNFSQPSIVFMGYLLNQKNNHNVNFKLLVFKWLFPEFYEDYDDDEDDLKKNLQNRLYQTDMITFYPHIISTFCCICGCKKQINILNKQNLSNKLSSFLIWSLENGNDERFPFDVLYKSYTYESMICSEKLVLSSANNEYLDGEQDFNKFNKEKNDDEYFNILHDEFCKIWSTDIMEKLINTCTIYFASSKRQTLSVIETQLSICYFICQFLSFHSNVKFNGSNEQFLQIEKFQRMLHNNIDSFIEESNIECLINLFTLVIKNIDLHQNKILNTDSHIDFLNNILPSKFIDLLINYLQVYLGTSRDFTSEEDMEVSNKKCNDISDHIFSVDDILDDSEETLVTTMHFNEKNNRTLKVVEWLCKWLSLNIDVDHHKKNREISNVLILLLNTQHDETFNFKLKTDIINFMLSKDSRLHSDMIASIVNTLRVLTRNYYRNQDYVKCILKLISRLFCQMSTNKNYVSLESSEEFQHHLKELKDFLMFFWNVLLQDNSTFNDHTCLAIANCTINLIQHSKIGFLTEILNSGDVGDNLVNQSPLCNNLMKLLSKKRYLMKISVALIMPTFFYAFNITSDQFAVSKKHEHLFNYFYSETVHLLQSSTASENNTFILHCILSIWRSSLNNRKSLMYFIIQLVKKYNVVNLNTALKTLNTITRLDKEISIYALVKRYLDFCIKLWLKEDLHIKDFCYQLLGYNSFANFIRNEVEIVFPQLVFRESCHSQFSDLLEIMGVPLNELLRSNLCAILSYILPIYAAANNETCVNNKDKVSKIKKASQIYSMLTSQLTVEVVNQYVNDNLVEIIKTVIGSYYEPIIYDKELFEEQLDIGMLDSIEPEHVYHNADVLNSFIKYLISSYSNTNIKNALDFICLTQDGIQRIIVDLTMKFNKSTHYYEKCSVMSRIHFFVFLLLPHFCQEQKASIAFMVHHILFFVMRFIHHSISIRERKSVDYRQLIELNHMLKISCDILLHLIKRCTEISIQIIVPHLPIIISIAFSLCQTHGFSQNLGLNLMKFLHSDGHSNLLEHLTHLHPPPHHFNIIKPFIKFYDNPYLVRLLEVDDTDEECILQIITKFMESERYYTNDVLYNYSSTTTTTHQQYGFYYLMKHFEDNLGRLNKSMAQTKNESIKATNCNRSSIFKLLTILWKNILNNKFKNGQISTDNECLNSFMNLAGCLGVLGPFTAFDYEMNMQPLFNLQKPKHFFIYDHIKSDELQRNAVIIIDYLLRYLMDENIDIVIQTGDVLRKILKLNKSKQTIDELMKYTSKYDKQLYELMLLLHPFKPSKKSSVIQEVTSNCSQKLDDILKNEHLWTSRYNNSSVDSSQKLVSELLKTHEFVEDQFLVILHPICSMKVDLCNFIFPYIIHGILKAQPTSHILISSYFTSILQQYVNNNEDICKQMVDNIIGTLQFLRNKQKPNSKNQWDNNFWLGVDYAVVAEAALKSKKCYASILFAEIYCLQHGNKTDERIQNVWLHVYKYIQDIDSVYGCSSNNLVLPINRMKMLEKEDDWLKCLIFSDKMLCNAQGDINDDQRKEVAICSNRAIIKSLNKLGCEKLLDVYLDNLINKHEITDEIRDHQFQAAWQATKWDIELKHEKLIPKASHDAYNHIGFHELLYGSMLGIMKKKLNLVEWYLECARLKLISLVSNQHNEGQCLNSLKNYSSKFRCLSEIQEISDAIFKNTRSLDEVFLRWQQEEFLCDFDEIEMILKQRCSLSQLVLKISDESDAQLQSFVKSSFFKLIECSRKANKQEICEWGLLKLKTMINSSLENNNDELIRWQLEEAMLFWIRGEVEAAKHLFNQLTNLKNDSPFMAKCLILFGDLLVETQSESPSVIMDSYYNKAISLISSSSSQILDEDIDAFHSLASYADVQYRKKMDYMNSSLFDEKMNLMNLAKSEICKMKEMNQINSRYYKTQEKQLQIDERELLQMKYDCNQFLLYSIENYLKCLLKSSKQDSCVYRLISLWFDNVQSNDLLHLLENYLPRIPSYKFAPLMYQLAARMNLDNNSFQCVLLQLVERTLIDHPHHVLPIIISLANAKYDDVVLSRSAKGEDTKIKKNKDSSEEQRITAAQNIISRTKQNKNGDISMIVVDLETLSRAYIELAYWNVDRHKGDTKPIKLDECLTLKKFKSMPYVAVPTISLHVCQQARYRDFVYVEGFEATFKLAGGINLPKIITCKCSDGVSRKQLVKGRDDLRQDAVMQQVFSSVNSFLKNDVESKKRNLHIRTYKVVPLSQRSGLLEWCCNTTPLGEYLCAVPHGAHVRYRPQDLKPMECRNMLTKAHSELNDKGKYNTYSKICERFQPVFRHFFMETFLAPDEWYLKRLAYTRSVATNSIVGYILGLGDRHVQNILIDLKTAELIHIDFGVAFEQGWNLPTPETIPFRLTRDIVDGMGVMEVEGVFRRCSEKTLLAMRMNKQVLLTILQVLLYDPLYDWTMSPLKAFRHQQSTSCADSSTHTVNYTFEHSSSVHKSDVRNKMAERVLLRLNQKLCGSEAGIQLSIQGHVSRLIQQATDTNNLSKLFPGWQPYV